MRAVRLGQPGATQVPNDSLIMSPPRQSAQYVPLSESLSAQYHTSQQPGIVLSTCAMRSPAFGGRTVALHGGSLPAARPTEATATQTIRIRTARRVPSQLAIVKTPVRMLTPN